MDYQVEMDLEAVRYLLTLKIADCKRLLHWIDQLKTSPFTTGQDTIRDGTDREIQVSHFDKFILYHWTDHPVKTVRINRIEKNG